MSETNNKLILDLRELAYILTYPTNLYDAGRVSMLSKLGIEGIYSYGPTHLGRVRVLGKGHSSVVVLAKHRSLGDVVIKIRRLDSKRQSLYYEGYLMRSIKFDVAPKVYYFNDDFIFMEYLDGVHLGDYIRGRGLMDVGTVLIRILDAAFKLDLSGVDHLELSRPHKHVLVLKDGRVKFIDFESARTTLNPCNLCRILSAFLRIYGDLRINLNSVKGLLKEYKLGRRRAFYDIISLISSNLGI